MVEQPIRPSIFQYQSSTSSVSFLRHPTFYAHVIGALFLLAAVVVFFRNMRTILALNEYQQMVLFLLASVAVTLHGISHRVLEHYGFNPLQ